MASKLFSLIALAFLAVIACSFGPTPSNALSVDISPNHVRGLDHHLLIAKKKRADSRRCKPRPSSSSVVVPSTTKAVIPTHSAASSTHSVSTTPKVVSTTKKTIAQASSTPVSTGSVGGGKAGLAWANPSSVPLKNFITQKTGMIYSWSPWKPDGADAAGLKFAPMFWGTDQEDDFKRLVVAGYANTALGFNEPDISSQSNLSPSTAASLWKQYLEPLKSEGYRLGSPAVTSGSSGKPWLQSFLNLCSGCTVDIIALHWYGTGAEDFIAYVKDFHNTFNLPIWVTEFACQNFSGGSQCTASEVTDFMNTVTAFMDSTDYVEQYFAFGFTHDMGNVNSLNQLLGSNNEPTALGWDYLT